MIDILLFAVVCYAITFLLTKSHLLSFARPDYYFFQCSFCMGFWVGVFVYLTNLTGVQLYDTWIVSAIFCHGLFGAASSYALCTFIGDYGLRFDQSI